MVEVLLVEVVAEAVETAVTVQEKVAAAEQIVVVVAVATVEGVGREECK